MDSPGRWERNKRWRCGGPSHCPWQARQELLALLVLLSLHSDPMSDMRKTLTFQQLTTVHHKCTARCNVTWAIWGGGLSAVHVQQQAPLRQWALNGVDHHVESGIARHVSGWSVVTKMTTAVSPVNRTCCTNTKHKSWSLEEACNRPTHGYQAKMSTRALWSFLPWGVAGRA